MKYDIKSSTYGRTLREICGDYHPEATTEEGRFTLPVNNQLVPVFISDKTKAQYPEIRVFPFWDEDSRYMGRVYGYSQGDINKGEYSDLMYKRSRADTTLREIRGLIEIYATGLAQLLKIRDALTTRIELFRLAESALVVQKNGWVQDGNIYKNAKYDSDLSIFSVYDSGNRLTKTTDVSSTPGSWNKTSEGLLVNPLTSLDNIELAKIYNGGLAFSDGTLLSSKGIMSLKIVRSEKKNDDRNPDVPKWVIHVVTKYKDVMSFDVGNTYSKVDVNEK